MPKVKGRVISNRIEQGQKFTTLQMNVKVPPTGEHVLVKWGSQRSLSQNAFLWVYYSWLIDHAGLKEHGFFCPEALHASLKSHFLSEKIMSKGEWQVAEEGSTTILTKSEFGEYIEKIDNFICSFFEIDTSAFFKEYEANWKM